MATTNQRNRSGGNRKAHAKPLTNEAMTQESDPMDEMHNGITEYVSQGTERFGELTRGREGQATLLALAAGFGVGLVIGCSLASGHRHPRRWSERLLPEGFGKQLMDRVESMLPDMINEHLRR